MPEVINGQASKSYKIEKTDTDLNFLTICTNEVV